MAESDLDPEDDRPPDPSSLLPILVIAPMVALAVRAAGRPLVDWMTWALFVLGSTGLLGLPVLYWSLDHRRTRVHQLMVAGAIAGMVPMGTALASGILGRLARGGWPYAQDMLTHGAPIPLAGLLPWTTFTRCLVEGLVVGAASGAVCWGLVRRRRTESAA